MTRLHSCDWAGKGGLLDDWPRALRTATFARVGGFYPANGSNSERPLRVSKGKWRPSGPRAARLEPSESPGSPGSPGAARRVRVRASPGRAGAGARRGGGSRRPAGLARPPSHSERPAADTRGPYK